MVTSRDRAVLSCAEHFRAWFLLDGHHFPKPFAGWIKSMFSVRILVLAFIPHCGNSPCLFSLPRLGESIWVWVTGPHDLKFSLKLLALTYGHQSSFPVGKWDFLIESKMRKFILSENSYVDTWFRFESYFSMALVLASPLWFFTSYILQSFCYVLLELSYSTNSHLLNIQNIVDVVFPSRLFTWG